mmetsp:Transcript_93283/g.264073  ORF Transcript_93283/g.264073 Transcript_93283/m.264073 type:complete len:258 (+) Transcript_93283:255-1028(+)
MLRVNTCYCEDVLRLGEEVKPHELVESCLPDLPDFVLRALGVLPKATQQGVQEHPSPVQARRAVHDDPLAAGSEPLPDLADLPETLEVLLRDRGHAPGGHPHSLGSRERGVAPLQAEVLASLAEAPRLALALVVAEERHEAGHAPAALERRERLEVRAAARGQAARADGDQLEPVHSLLELPRRVREVLRGLGRLAMAGEDLGAVAEYAAEVALREDAHAREVGAIQRDGADVLLPQLELVLNRSEDGVVVGVHHHT